MKKIIAPILLSTLLFSSFVLTTSQKEIKVSEAITPTNYYNSITSSMKGDTLKVALYNIIKGHTKYPYGSLEVAMKVTDRDYTLSPLQENESEDYDPYMRLLYADYNGSTSTAKTWKTSQGSYGTTEEGKYVWNKEHIWAKSNGFGKASGCEAYSDLHHLRASDWKCNNTRGDSPFTVVTNHSTSTASFDWTQKRRTDNYYTSSTFEPRDSDKGDVARALFYMATRYYNGEGSNGTHLTLTTGTDSSGGKWGYLDTLLAWHEADPVDEFEAHRNDLVYGFQKNRNPYIDHPEYARAVFKNEPIQEPDKLTNLTYTGTPSKTTYKEGEYFDSTGLTITATFTKEDSSTYTKDVTEHIVWSPNPLTKNTTTVTGTYSNGDVTKSITITGLTVSSLDSIRVSGNPDKTIYEEGDTFVSTGLKVYAKYGQEEIDVTNNAIWSNTPLVKNQTSVTVTYGELNATYTGILVKEKSLSTATVEFKDYGSSTDALSKDTIQNDLVKGKDIVTVSAVTKAFKGPGGVRFGSGSGGGSITLTMSSTNVTKLIITAMVYNKDNTTVTVKTNNETSGTFTPASTFEGYEINVNKNVTSITISSSSSNNRFYLKSIDIVSGSGSGVDSITAWGISYLHIGDVDFDGQGTGLCKSLDLYKYAKVALFNLASSEEDTITKLQNDSKYSNEYDRYLAWARACQDNSPLANSFELISNQITNTLEIETNNTAIIIIIIASVTALGFASLLLFKKRKH